MFGVTPEAHGVTNALKKLNKQFDKFEKQVHMDVRNLTIDLAIKI